MTLLPSILGYVMVLWRQCKLTFLDVRWFTALKGQCPGSIILLVASFVFLENDATTFEVIMTSYSQNYMQTKISVSVTFDGTTT